MDNEVLNLEYHKKRLILKALNQVGRIKYAAPKLGISERNLHRLKEQYDLKRVDGTWTIGKPFKHKPENAEKAEKVKRQPLSTKPVIKIEITDEKRDVVLRGKRLEA